MQTDAKFELIKEYVNLQIFLIKELMHQYPAVLRWYDDCGNRILPARFRLILNNVEWSAFRHGLGVTFKNMYTNEIVNIDVIKDTPPNLITAGRLADWYESKNLVANDENVYEVCERNLAEVSQQNSQLWRSNNGYILEVDTINGVQVDSTSKCDSEGSK